MNDVRKDAATTGGNAVGALTDRSGALGPRPTTKTEYAIAVLQEEIRAGRIRPGEQLNFVHLSKRFGISPTPIREAVRVLQAQGLVEERPHKKVAVTDLADADVEELFRLREVLEPMVTAMAIEKISDKEIERLWELLEEEQRASASGDFDKAMLANTNWHFYLYDIAKTSFAKGFIEHLWRGIRWGGSWRSKPKVAESDSQHVQIMNAIALRAPQAAAELMAVHIRSGKERQLAHRQLAGAQREEAKTES